MKISFVPSALKPADSLVVTIKNNAELTESGRALDEATAGAVTRAMQAEGFRGEKDTLLEIIAPCNIAAKRIVLIGLGDPKTLKLTDIEKFGADLYRHLSVKRLGAVHVALDGLCPGEHKEEEAAAHFAYGALLRSYRFDRYKTNEEEEKKPKLDSLTLHLECSQDAEIAFKHLQAIAEGVFLTRQLVSAPPNDLYPESLAAEARRLGKLGVKVTILGEEELESLGMNCLLAVGMGSARESKVAIMEWNGAREESSAPVALAGKGVTFDSGGLSIKAAAGMEEMKFDMGGAGVVFGAMKVLASRKARVNVVGICGLVENMPSGKAQRPSDIVTSYSGQTVEVLSTDAEGRLVLADILSYVQDRYKPRAIIDLATLTGAIIIALGHDFAGIFSNNDSLAQALTCAGQIEDEPVWRLPLDASLDRLLDSDAADMRNIAGRAGDRTGGSIVAAQFLQRFIKDGTPWVHIDIAGTAWSNKAKATAAKGATGYGVRLLNRLIEDQYEQSQVYGSIM